MHLWIHIHNDAKYISEIQAVYVVFFFNDVTDALKRYLGQNIKEVCLYFMQDSEET